MNEHEEYREKISRNICPHCGGKLVRGEFTGIGPPICSICCSEYEFMDSGWIIRHEPNFSELSSKLDDDISNICSELRELGAKHFGSGKDLFCWPDDVYAEEDDGTQWYLADDMDN